MKNTVITNVYKGRGNGINIGVSDIDAVLGSVQLTELSELLRESKTHHQKLSISILQF